jgi:hypothetical protein
MLFQTLKKAKKMYMKIYGRPEQVSRGGEWRPRSRRPIYRGGIQGRLLATLLVVAVATGCDSLLEAELPGSLSVEALNDPALAETLALGVQGDFECAFRGYLFRELLWADVIKYHGTTLNWLRTEQRAATTREGGNQNCENGREPVWLPMQIAIGQANVVIALIEGFDAGTVEDPDFLVGKANMYKGYATQMLSEHYCGIVFDGDGVEKSRADGFQRAVELFTLAIDRASLSGAGEASDIVNMARVGRARAKLNLGDGPGAITDAEAVDIGFIGLANYETSPTRLRWDRPRSMDAEGTLQAAYRNLQIGGVSDPRVPTKQHSAGVTPQYTLEWWVQLKYNSRGSDIPISTWREARLMIAEADPTRSVAIINELRLDPTGIHSELDSSAWPLPTYAGGTPAQIAAQVIEERRRELFLQGTKVGDDLRTGEFQNWDTGVAASGLQIDENVSCMPVPIQEFL